mmetsp:Transcript_8856/g.54498  ORF Transcript_8856/g.54498 Transcript_8856/m.54498 type:complete len:220 (+) Transcript_8856:2826-3485(+)
MAMPSVGRIVRQATPLAATPSAMARTSLATTAKNRMESKSVSSSSCAVRLASGRQAPTVARAKASGGVVASINDADCVVVYVATNTAPARVHEALEKWFHHAGATAHAWVPPARASIHVAPTFVLNTRISSGVGARAAAGGGREEPARRTSAAEKHARRSKRGTVRRDARVNIARTARIQAAEARAAKSARGRTARRNTSHSSFTWASTRCSGPLGRGT